jgi:hypothetical protein
MARAGTGAYPVGAGVLGAGKSKWLIPAGVVVLLAAAVGGTWWLAHRGGGPVGPPKFTQVTFQQGLVKSARFLHDGQTVISASRFGSEAGLGLHVGTTETVGVRSLDTPADDLAAVSVNDDILLVTDERSVGPGYAYAGTLKEMHYGGGAPRAIMESVQYADWDPEGKKFAVVRYVPETHKYQLEYPAGTVLYGTAGWVSNPRFSRDGKTIAFLDHPIFGDDQGSVAMVDLEGKVRKWKGVYGSTQGLAWSPDGKEIWFSGSRNGGVTRSMWAAAMDGSERGLLAAPGTLDIQDTVAAGQEAGAKATGGKTLVTSLEERRVQMIVTPEFPEARDFTWMSWAFAQRFTQDGTQLLFGDQNAGPMYGTFLRNVDGSPAVRLGDGDPLDISPDGKYAMSRLPEAPDQLELLPTGTGEGHQLTHEKIDFSDGRWMDNTRFFALGNEPGHPPRMYVVDLEGHVKAMTPEAGRVRAVSADGKKVMMGKRENGKFAITILPVVDEGGLNVHLGTGVAGPVLADDEGPLDFTADGNGMFSQKAIGSNKEELWQTDFRTGKRTLLYAVTSPGIPAVSRGMNAGISRDGKSYAYQYHPAMSTEYLVEGLR